MDSIHCTQAVTTSRLKLGICTKKMSLNVLLSLVVLKAKVKAITEISLFLTREKPWHQPEAPSMDLKLDCGN